MGFCGVLVRRGMNLPLQFFQTEIKMGKNILLIFASIFTVNVALAHGDVTPQVINTEGLESLGENWKESNPYRGNKVAIEIGSSGYNQNCARCHGLGVVSGGIAPDLRYLPVGDEGDEYYNMAVRNGKVRNGRVYMPKFEGILSQEALWAIRTYVESVHLTE